MFALYDSGQGKQVGRLSEEQLQALVDYMQEEFEEDNEYYLTSDDCEIMAEQGFDAGLVKTLRDALAGRDEMDIRYEREQQ
jgi:hypothetical protein